MRRRPLVDALTDAILDLARGDPGAFSGIGTFAVGAPLFERGDERLRLAAIVLAQRLDQRIESAKLGRGRVTDRRLDQRLRRDSA